MLEDKKHIRLVVSCTAGRLYNQIISVYCDCANLSWTWARIFSCTKNTFANSFDAFFFFSFDDDVELRYVN